MTKTIKRGKGSEACPRGYYALYDHPNCNNSVPGRVLVADESVGNFRDAGDSSFNDSVTCVVNKTTRTLELYEHEKSGGERVDIPPGGPYDLRYIKNANGKSLSDLVSSTRLGDPPSPGLIEGFRRLGYQVAGGKVDKDTGTGQGSSGPLGRVADLGFVATGGKMAGKDTQSEQVAAAEKKAAQKAAATPLVFGVSIKTAKEDWAGTDDDVLCRFQRADRKSEWVKLDSAANDFEAGSWRTYQVSMPGDFGTPQRIALKTSGDDKWLLEWVVVTLPDQTYLHAPYLNDTYIWISQGTPKVGEAGSWPWRHEADLYLGPGDKAVKGEKNPDAENAPETWGESMMKRVRGK
ncbi:PLAT/LH2 domain-containing protein [Streptomyces roseochromogenus]|uniref:PLAT domain-containing protein n=1 Tax=Streptomyces roseochromogenus subsp. oscitans DS 12.976 TaxID=1352936 RepID=V6KQQ9_STRRC|nr:PLAT/LH2 domain-containing protein [Streptomyces roseochromogenus]EST34520.1 hypothetical protein M878_10005 [Streptomyces roseochromogenus subsp. oscitans DS 12.976]